MLTHVLLTAARAFERTLLEPRAAQSRTLLDILHRNRDCVFGREHDFSSIRDIAEFQARLPLRRHEQFEPWLARMAHGEPYVLTGERTLFFEQTSGSTGAAKLLPVTAGALAAYRRGLSPWLADLLRHRPAIAAGRWYFSISPAARRERLTAGGAPIGAASDLVYFGDGLGTMLAEKSALPFGVAAAANLEDWRTATLFHLAACEDLTLISIWSPTFLLELVKALPARAREIADGLRRGRLERADDPADAWTLSRALPERARLLDEIAETGAVDTRRLWPRLDTISCWSDAAARHFIPELARAFPQAWIQGKGLLATEALVSVPLIEAAAPVLAPQAGFFEFIDEDGTARLADELSEGACYGVALTTYGGLYRYLLGDRVRVRGYYCKAPMLEFIGREGLVSDVCGEKLNEAFVLAQLDADQGFAMLAPVLKPKPRYRLFLDRARWGAQQAAAYALRLDQRLRRNPHYDYARRLGQLSEIDAQLVDDPMRRYAQAQLARGQRLGEIKAPALRAETDWAARFALALGAAEAVRDAV